MYKLVKLHKPNLPLMTSKNLVTLWQELDNYKKYNPVIVDDSGNIVAGHNNAFEWAKLKDFKIKGA